MASDMCTRRLAKELSAYRKDPVKSPRITVMPNEKNLLEIHYVIEGSEGTPYEGGVYHGKLLFPKEYPLKPPGVMMITPSGRFQVNRKLCLSMSDFHPESWNPMWSISTILTGLYSFMIESASTLGSVETSTYRKRVLASQSLEWNVKNSPVFVKLFPEYLLRYEEEQSLKREGKLTTPSSNTTTETSTTERGRFEVPRAFLGAAWIFAIVSIVVAVRFL